MTGPPDYVGVGTRRAGAEWWHALLLAQPGVEPRRRSRRSLSFFSRFCLREMTDEDVRAYHREFPRRRGGLAGEWSPDYLYEPWTPPLLRRAAPEARLLVMLSDPVERFRRRLRVELLRGDRETAGYRTPEALTRGLYASQLRHLRSSFGAERILVLQYERCLRDPAGELARTLRFLRLRSGPGRRVALGAAARATADRAARRATRGTLWPDIEAALVAELEPEVRALGELAPGLDLTLWPELARLA